MLENPAPLAFSPIFRKIMRFKNSSLFECACNELHGVEDHADSAQAVTFGAAIFPFGGPRLRLRV
jgi:hypothetical protein